MDVGWYGEPNCGGNSGYNETEHTEVHYTPSSSSSNGNYSLTITEEHKVPSWFGTAWKVDQTICLNYNKNGDVTGQLATGSSGRYTITLYNNGVPYAFITDGQNANWTTVLNGFCKLGLSAEWFTVAFSGELGTLGLGTLPALGAGAVGFTYGGLGFKEIGDGLDGKAPIADRLGDNGPTFDFFTGLRPK